LKIKEKPMIGGQETKKKKKVGERRKKGSKTNVQCRQKKEVIITVDGRTGKEKGQGEALHPKYHVMLVGEGKKKNRRNCKGQKGLCGKRNPGRQTGCRKEKNKKN